MTIKTFLSACFACALPALVLTAPAIATNTNESVVHDCDLLAASTTDPSRVADGVPDSAVVYSKALPACRDAVRERPNEPRFWFQLGRVLNLVQTADHNPEAVYWLTKAYEAGHMEAAAWLGSIFIDGEPGVPQDMNKGLSLYLEAAEAGNLFAMAGLGSAYFYGSGVAPDPREAVVWYARAAEAGNSWAMNELGRIRHFGLAGTEVDYDQAVAWYRKAADAGWTGAMYNAATILAQQSRDQEEVLAAANMMFEALARGNRNALDEMNTNAERWPAAFRRELQRLMQASGAYDAAIDGDFGPATRRGLEEIYNKPEVLQAAANPQQ